jgi:hypothetical protein
VQTSADKKAISASKKTISTNDPGGQTAAVGIIAANQRSGSGFF